MHRPNFINPLPLFFRNKNNVKVLDLKHYHFSSQRSGDIIGSLIRDRWAQKILLEHKPYVRHCARCKGGHNEENACGLCLQGVSYMISKTCILNTGLYKIDDDDEEEDEEDNSDLLGGKGGFQIRL